MSAVQCDVAAAMAELTIIAGIQRGRNRFIATSWRRWIDLVYNLYQCIIQRLGMLVGPKRRICSWQPYYKTFVGMSQSMLPQKEFIFTVLASLFEVLVMRRTISVNGLYFSAALQFLPYRSNRDWTWWGESLTVDFLLSADNSTWCCGCWVDALNRRLSERLFVVYVDAPKSENP